MLVRSFSSLVCISFPCFEIQARPHLVVAWPSVILLVINRGRFEGCMLSYKAEASTSSDEEEIWVLARGNEFVFPSSRDSRRIWKFRFLILNLRVQLFPKQGHDLGVASLSSWSLGLHGSPILLYLTSGSDSQIFLPSCCRRWKPSLPRKLLAFTLFLHWW